MPTAAPPKWAAWSKNRQAKRQPAKSTPINTLIAYKIKKMLKLNHINFVAHIPFPLKRSTLAKTICSTVCPDNESKCTPKFPLSHRTN